MVIISQRASQIGRHHPSDLTNRRYGDWIILRKRGVQCGASKLLGAQLGFEIAALFDALQRLDLG
jgi:hypothetical protein